MNIINNHNGLRIKFVEHRKLELQQSKLKKVCAVCGWLFKPIRSLVFCKQCHAGLMQNGKVQAIKAMLMAGSDHGQ